MKYYLGMDIGGTKCAVIISEKGSDRIKDKIRFDTDVKRGWKLIVEELIYSAEQLIQRNGITASDVIACGVSCGGPLDSDKGIIMCPPNLPDWDNICLASIVTDRLGVPCKVVNDADACAIAEWKFGAGRGCGNMIFLTFGTGMGAGLILGGKLYQGASGCAGEVGHIRLEHSGPVGYGKEGSFEGFCSGGGLANLGRLMLNEYKSETTLKGKEITAKSLAMAAFEGDEFALSVYSECGKKLGCGLSILIDVLNPERIVIGSIYQRSGELLKKSMYDAINREALGVNASKCEIVAAELGDDIGDYAAIGVAAEYAEAIK